jgi:hypothetical protein
MWGAFFAMSLSDPPFRIHFTRFTRGGSAWNYLGNRMNGYCLLFDPLRGRHSLTWMILNMFDPYGVEIEISFRR